MECCRKVKNIKFLDEVVSFFEKLPGVGKKTATRYAFYIAEKFDDEDVTQAVKAINDIHENVTHCKKCNMLSASEICDICKDELRDKTKILVVKDTRDILTLEATHQYNGLYYVLGGLISPLDGIGPDDLNIDKLEEISKDPAVNEVILATSFTPQGETTALYLERILARENLKITRIAYGLPAGGDIEYADERTIQRALESRK